MPEHYLTAEQVAERLQVNVQSVWRYVRRGFIPHFWVGKLVRFDPKAIDEWVAAGGKREDHKTTRVANLNSKRRLQLTRIIESRPNWQSVCTPEEINLVNAVCSGRTYSSIANDYGLSVEAIRRRLFGQGPHGLSGICGKIVRRLSRHQDEETSV